MSASLQLEGVKELTDALRALPEDVLKNEFGPIVMASAQGLASELKTSYSKGGTGTLSNRVTVLSRKDLNGLRAIVLSLAPHSHLYEYGTVKRFTNETGANRGTMPAQPTFVPAVIRWRHHMVEQVRTALRALRIRGFSGSPEVRES